MRVPCTARNLTGHPLCQAAGPACAGQPDCRCLGTNGACLSLHPSLLCKSNIIIGKWQISHLASMHTISDWFHLSLRKRVGKGRPLASLEANVCASSQSVLLLKTPWPWHSPGFQGCYFGYQGTVKHAEMPVLKRKEDTRWKGICSTRGQAPLRACVLSHLSRVPFCVTLWTVAHQAPLSIGLSRQGEWSGLPCPPPGDLPNPGVEPMSHVSSIGRRVLYH